MNTNQKHCLRHEKERCADHCGEAVLELDHLPGCGGGQVLLLLLVNLQTLSHHLPQASLKY
jgi:hypothetical protein